MTDITVSGHYTKSNLIKYWVTKLTLKPTMVSIQIYFSYFNKIKYFYCLLFHNNIV